MCVARLQRVTNPAANPAFGFDKRLAAVVSSGGSLVRGYMAEAATLQKTGAPVFLACQPSCKPPVLPARHELHACSISCQLCL